jgi:hypothetical protein
VGLKIVEGIICSITSLEPSRLTVTTVGPAKEMPGSWVKEYVCGAGVWADAAAANPTANVELNIRSEIPRLIAITA